MRDRLRARKERVLEHVDLGEMLREYGYSVVPDRMREQQFSCDLHGPDNKPSARYYGESNTTYCWVCQKTRDAISYMMEKEGLGFVEAVEALERRLNLAPLPWEDDGDAPARPEDDFDAIVSRSSSYVEEYARMRKILDSLTRDRLECRPGDPSLDCSTLLGFWEAFDRVDYGVAREKWPEPKGIEALQKLKERVFEKIRVSERGAP